MDGWQELVISQVSPYLRCTKEEACLPMAALGDDDESAKMEDDAKTMEQAAESIGGCSEHATLHTAGSATAMEGFHATIASMLKNFADVCRDKSSYRALLNNEGYSAQNMLDLLQMFLDHPQLENSSRGTLLTALLRLSKKTSLYPRCLVLRDVELGEAPVTAGHFGEIWRGRSHEQAVCVKVVRLYERSRVEKLLKAFWKEALLWAHISHINLLPFYGVYHLKDAHGRICLVSPWMHHGNVNDYLRNNPEAVRPLLLRDIIEGLSYLHGECIVHGDLKGANILVSSSGRACLADFGLSTVIGADILEWTSVRSTASSAGTLRWQAPELISSEDSANFRLSTASDIYAFSCVCYEIMTGKIPFYELPYDATVILRVILGNIPSRPSRNSPPYLEWGMTDGIWLLMNDCWKKNPKGRPTASQVKECLALECGVVDKRSQDAGDILSPSEFRNAIQIPSSHAAKLHAEERSLPSSSLPFGSQHPVHVSIPPSLELPLANIFAGSEPVATPEKNEPLGPGDITGNQPPNTNVQTRSNKRKMYDLTELGECEDRDKFQQEEYRDHSPFASNPRRRRRRFSSPS